MTSMHFARMKLTISSDIGSRPAAATDNMKWAAVFDGDYHREMFKGDLNLLLKARPQPRRK